MGSSLPTSSGYLGPDYFGFYPAGTGPQTAGQRPGSAQSSRHRPNNDMRQHEAMLMLKNIPFVSVRVACASTVREGKGAFASSSYTAYTIELGVPKDAFRAANHTVLHRYSRFAALHEAL